MIIEKYFFKFVTVHTETRNCRGRRLGDPYFEGITLNNNFRVFLTGRGRPKGAPTSFAFNFFITLRAGTRPAPTQ